ncbi:uncharacterized protein IWZ02DRAFT_430062 [Phyllosticta citriasiana]|uniref:uncharacterized protein n=1 Tax=Phyllosticta citriasiana TaxID=595635 RepID=UPI0030FD46F0
MPGVVLAPGPQPAPGSSSSSSSSLTSPHLTSPRPSALDPTSQPAVKRARKVAWRRPPQREPSPHGLTIIAFSDDDDNDDDDDDDDDDDVSHLSAATTNLTD